ncbi:MAG TPA: sugar kinase [Vicinamibacteria bacterium]|nr:sugar kinase [Vicinamibacteria bacterium]
MAHDVLAFGEALLRLQPTGDERIEDAALFHAYVGGAELNTACALASLGLRAAWFSVLPEGPLGRRVLQKLRGAGVDVALVKTAPGRLGSYWCEYGQPPRAIEVIYDRRDSSVCNVRAEDVPGDALRAARLFYVSGITPALSPRTREVALAMAESARAAGVTVAADLNYRARLWAAAEAAPVLERLAKAAHVVIATEEDLKTLYGLGGAGEDVAQAAQARFDVRTLVLTRGGLGALSLEAGRIRSAPAFPVSRVDRIGAGDAFTAGFLWASLTGRAEQALDCGLALAALKHSIPGDALATTPAELLALLERDTREIRR